MALETFDYPDGTDISTISGYTVVNGVATVNAAARLDIDAFNTAGSGGIFIVRDMASSAVTISTDLVISGSTTTPAGLALRFIDTDNTIQVNFRTTDGWVRVVEKVGGVNTVIADAYPSGYSNGSGGSLEVVDDGTNLTVNFNGAQLLTTSSTEHQSSTLFGLWAAGTEYDFDNFAYPDVALTGLKQVNLELPSTFVGLSGVNYSLSNLITGEQIDYGNLTTASSPVNIQFENDNVASGSVLVAYASNIASGNDSEALVMWDKVTVSAVE